MFIDLLSDLLFVTSLYKCVLNVSSSNCWLDHPMHFALRKTTTLPLLVMG